MLKILLKLGKMKTGQTVNFDISNYNCLQLTLRFIYYPNLFNILRLRIYQYSLLILKFILLILICFFVIEIFKTKIYKKKSYFHCFF